MKTKKIHRPSELKDGDKVTFTLIGMYENKEMHGEVSDNSFHECRVTNIGGIPFTFEHVGDENIFEPYIKHVERIIEESIPEMTIEKYIELKLKETEEKQERVNPKHTELLSYLIENKTKEQIEYILGMTIPEYCKLSMSEQKPESSRIEKYDLISKEAIDNLDEAKDKLQQVVDLVKELKKLGIKIKI
jgi:hypothetical protein